MIKLYQLEKRIVNKFLYLFGKGNTFVIYSPQRSFSNFFRQLIEMNLFINYEQGKKNLNYYKHNPKVKKIQLAVILSMADRELLQHLFYNKC